VGGQEWPKLYLDEVNYYYVLEESSGQKTLFDGDGPLVSSGLDFLFFFSYNGLVKGGNIR